MIDNNPNPIEYQDHDNQRLSTFDIGKIVGQISQVNENIKKVEESQDFKNRMPKMPFNFKSSLMLSNEDENMLMNDILKQESEEKTVEKIQGSDLQGIQGKGYLDQKQGEGLNISEVEDVEQSKMTIPDSLENY